ncbi:hypothetical protein ACLKA6_011999 [Drosophila palustris]
MARNSREYTAFTLPGRGLFHWKVMPFGLHSAPATFQRALDSVIGPDMEPFAFAYLDDITVSGATLEEQILEQILSSQPRLPGTRYQRRGNPHGSGQDRRRSGTAATCNMP